MEINMADLITLAEYKIAKGLSSTSEDSKIEPLIVSVSSFIRNYCNRNFTDYYNTDKTEVFNILWSDQFVQLSETPVVSITSVSERTAVTSDYAVITDYYLDPATDVVYKVGSDGASLGTFPPGPGAVKVIYKAGWAAAPSEIKQATIDLVTYYLKEEYKQQKTIGSSSIQNAPGPSTAHSAELPAHIKRVLDLYRNY
jgi:hypothetical protein